jgi:hypothetical protein
MNLRAIAGLTCENGGTAKGQVALTNLTLLATISVLAKGA